jgi:hypothetical protein
MRHSIPGQTPSSKRPDGQAELKQRRVYLREDKSAPDSRRPTAQISTELPSLQADNVGLEQLVAALTRIPIPRPKKRTSNSAT